MLILAILISIILLPIYLTSLLLLYVFKIIIHTSLKLKHKSRLILLDSADTYWTVGDSFHNQSYILTILKNKPGGNIVTEIKDIIEERLLKHTEDYAKVLCSLHNFLGYPYFLKERFQSQDFITVIDTQTTTYSCIKDIIYDLSSKALPLNGEALWEIIIIQAPTEWKYKSGLKDDQIALILRENHTVTDGLSLMNLIANSFGDQVLDLSMYLKNIPRSPKSNIIVKILKCLLLFMIVPGHLLIATLQKKFNRKLWKAPNIVHKQNVAYKCEDGRGLVEKIKVMKRDIGDVSFTEILIAAISASLNRHFLKNTINIPDSVLLLIVATKDLKPMTVNNVPILRNQFGMIIFELPIIVNSNSMLKRLEILKKRARPMLKSVLPLVDSFILFNLMGLFPSYIIKWLFPMSETVGISNLPGFPKLNICSGYEVDDIFFFLPQRDTNGIGFSILTYDDRLHIGLTADEASIPSKSHCEDIIQDFFKNLDDLRIELDKNKLDNKVIELE